LRRCIPQSRCRTALTNPNPRESEENTAVNQSTRSGKRGAVMLNFKKKQHLHPRQASEGWTAPPEQEAAGRNPCRLGLPPAAAKPPWRYKDRNAPCRPEAKNVVLLLCDMTAPMLPCICPPSELEGEHSLGSILAAAHVTEPLIKHNLVTLKKAQPYLTHSRHEERAKTSIPTRPTRADCRRRSCWTD
jgi:hypothetical protein